MGQVSDFGFPSPFVKYFPSVALSYKEETQALQECIFEEAQAQ